MYCVAFGSVLINVLVYLLNAYVVKQGITLCKTACNRFAVDILGSAGAERQSYRYGRYVNVAGLYIELVLYPFVADDFAVFVLLLSLYALEDERLVGFVCRAEVKLYARADSVVAVASRKTVGSYEYAYFIEAVCLKSVGRACITVCAVYGVVYDKHSVSAVSDKLAYGNPVVRLFLYKVFCLERGNDFLVGLAFVLAAFLSLLKLLVGYLDVLLLVVETEKSLIQHFVYKLGIVVAAISICDAYLGVGGA